jgi:[acyl-carrier-protein] S-malonyltransferase
VNPVAWVAGTPIDESEVDAREAAVRTGPARNTLPAGDSSEGRQLRRWLVQLMAAERLIAQEHRENPAGEAPPLAEIAEDGAALLGLGSVAATLLERNPLARAVFRAVTGHVRVPRERVAAYHAGNPERFTVRERRRVRHAVLTTPEEPPVFRERTLHRGELAGTLDERVFGARAGETVGPVRDPLGWHVITVDAVEPAGRRPLRDAEAQLLAVARRRAFTAWLDGRFAERVRLAPGYEHPGDPGQPDNTHRH